MTFKKGHKPSLESRKKMSASQKKRFKNKRHHNWNGGEHINCGYVRVWCPDHPNTSSRGYLPKHRLVMEKHLNRYLTSNEEIHHINNNKLDNRIENLQLFTNHSIHLSTERKERFWSSGRKSKNPKTT